MDGIKVLITDIDGVLTDGGFYYTANGLTMKKFNTKDGAAIFRLRQESDIKWFVVSSADDAIIKKRISDLGADRAYYGVYDKVAVVQKILEENGWGWDETAYVGDDIPDVAVMRKVKESFCPVDAHNEVKQVARFICSARGGEGVLAEVVSLLVV